MSALNLRPLPFDIIVVATSAGVDSMALLDSLYQQQKTVIACYVNHGQRPQEIAQEIACITAYCKERSIPFCEQQIDFSRYHQGMNKQAFFREERYRLLYDVAATFHAQCVVTAHHLDDQAETQFMRLVKAYDIAALKGIMPLQQGAVHLCRPFLHLRKHVLVAYCQKHHIPYCEDSSNQSSQYFRNRIRQEVFPILEAENKQFVPQFVQTIDKLLYFYDQAAATYREVILAEIPLIKDDRIRLAAFYTVYQRCRNEYEQQLFCQIVLQECFQISPLSEQKIAAFCQMMNSTESTGSVECATCYLIKKYGYVYRKWKHSEDVEQVCLQVREGVMMSKFGQIQCLSAAEADVGHPGVWVTQQQLEAGLLLQTAQLKWKLKRKSGSKQLNRLYIDRKVLPPDRKTALVLTTYEDVVLYDFTTQCMSCELEALQQACRGCLYLSLTSNDCFNE